MYGEALAYTVFQEMLDVLLPLVNRKRTLQKLTPYVARAWHWHGLRYPGGKAPKYLTHWRKK